MSGLLVLFFSIIPKAFFSRIFGVFARTKFSAFVMLNWFIRKFNINLNEVDIPEKGFASMDQFFLRKLKKGTHVVDKGEFSIVSPVDARIDEFGAITGTRVLQAKNIDYLLADLIPNHLHHFFIDGSFMTLYLSPQDYHRVHAPVDGNVLGYLYVPGQLFPVMQCMVEGVNRLFCKNERLITFIQTPFGKCAVCKVGAMNVGRITLSYDEQCANIGAFRRKKENFYNSAMQVQVHRGDEIGQFHFGSTVILLFEKDMTEFGIFKQGMKVRMGQKLGVLKKKSH